MKRVIFDIDGVLADCTHRLEHILVAPKDWDRFDELLPYDSPIDGGIELLRTFYGIGHNITLLTGRNERVRRATMDWLQWHDIPFTELHMRGLKDFRPAAEVKLHRLLQLGYYPEHVMTIFEDEPNTVRAMRAKGYHVCVPLEWEEGWHEASHSGGRRSDDHIEEDQIEDQLDLGRTVEPLYRG